MSVRDIESSRFLLPQPEVVYQSIWPFDIETVRTVRSQPPTKKLSHEVRRALSPIILPELLSDASLVELERAIDRGEAIAGSPLEYELFLSYLTTSNERGERERVPFDLFSSFRYRNEVVLGPTLVSFNHPIMTDQHMTIEQKEKLLRYTLGVMRHEWPIICIFTVALSKNSFTRREFKKFFNHHSVFVQVAEQDKELHFIQGTMSEKKFQELIEDATFQKILLELGVAWDANFDRELPDADQMKKQLRTSLVQQLIGAFRGT